MGKRRKGIDAGLIDASFVPRPRSDVAKVELDGEAVLAAAVGIPAQLLTHWMNATGTIVWDFFDGVASLDELAADISDAFGADPDIVRHDVVELTRELGRAGLLEGVEAELGQDQPGNALQPQGLPLGADVPPFALLDLDGRRVSLAGLRGRRLVLVNWSPSCGFCTRIADHLAELLPELHERGTELVLVASGSADDNRSLLRSSGLDCVALLQDDDVDLFRGLGTPCAYLVDEDGGIASSLALGAYQVPALARLAAGRDQTD